MVFGLVSLIAFGKSSLVFAAKKKPIRFLRSHVRNSDRAASRAGGLAKFGPDQCRNDKDGSVDHDERLPITGVTPGRYDIKIGYKDGKTCRVQNVPIESGKAFSIEDKDLADCSICLPLRRRRPILKLGLQLQHTGRAEGPARRCEDR